MQAKKQQVAKDDEFSPDSKFKKPKDWKERKAQRQKYWSVSQGFRFGRKLEEWGEDPPARPTSGRTGSKDGDEDAEMQEAIRRSLTDAPGQHSSAANVQMSGVYLMIGMCILHLHCIH